MVNRHSPPHSLLPAVALKWPSSSSLQGHDTQDHRTALWSVFAQAYSMEGAHIIYTLAHRTCTRSPWPHHDSNTPTGQDVRPLMRLVSPDNLETGVADSSSRFCLPLAYANSQNMPPTAEHASPGQCTKCTPSVFMLQGVANRSSCCHRCARAPRLPSKMTGCLAHGE